ncbi:MAG: polysaccharide deacetylase [Clostridiales bacterium]|nr:polysaccharide deacetylase [Clostridiales bacterium]
MKGKAIRRRSGTFKITLISNVLLSFIILLVGMFSTFSGEEFKETDGREADIYRNGKITSQGVSLMFNVYWGTEEVYSILEILEEFNAKATFFIGGCWADDNAKCVRDIYILGHEIGNHGYFHKDHSKLNLLENKREITSCNQFIELLIGVSPHLFAPPSGAYNDETLSACRELSMKTVLWSRDTIDWRDKDKKLIYKRATQNITGGEFVLMHPMKETVEALADILTYYKENNLSAITVSENLQYKG